MDLVGVCEDWLPTITPMVEQPFFSRLEQIVETDRARGPVFPPRHQVFRALSETCKQSVRVVILGQDPYHGLGQAEGLAFSVPPGVAQPPSLRNIYNELDADLGHRVTHSGTLLPWARQGVLLLNAVLTVRESEPGSHAGIGWERITDEIIASVSRSEQPTAFVLWGAFAQKKKSLIDLSRHFVQESVHPSPLSANRGFFGSKPFSRVNNFLERQGRGTIDWQGQER